MTGRAHACLLLAALSAAACGGDSPTPFDPADLVGRWTGRYEEQPLGRSGAVAVVVSERDGGLHLQLDLGGTVPGLPDPAISAVLSAHRATFDAASPISLGDVSGHVTGDGGLTFRCVGMRGAYEQVAVDGTWTSAGLVADAELTLRAGAVSRATVTLSRR